MLFMPDFFDVLRCQRLWNFLAADIVIERANVGSQTPSVSRLLIFQQDRSFD